MDNKTFSYRKFFAELAKAKKFANEYYAEHGEMPDAEMVNEAKVLTPEEIQKIELDIEIGGEIAKDLKTRPCDWDYIWNEETWNASYANGGLKRYYEWCDGGATAPYKEDLWNTVENRAANWNDWRRDEQGNPVLDENGYYIYDNCVRCWLGALNAPGAKFPWAVVVPPIPFKGTIRFVYGNEDAVYPWGEADRTFGRGFGVASIPVELGEEFLLHDGVTTFEPEKLKVDMIGDLPKQEDAVWDYIWNEETWNASYENGGLKRYYEWCDGGATAPYKEDLWNTVENRAANWTDWRRDEQGNPVLDENGYYIYDNCERCWLGALNAPGAKYPWAVVQPPIPFNGVIKFAYNNEEPVYPWGEYVRTFGRGFGCASIPTELGDEYLLHDGVTTFEPEKLDVKLIYAYN